jgi:hypothetical protein
MKAVTLGGFELVSLPELKLLDVIAKVDTGAYSGAIHCTDIKVVQRGPSHKNYLSFKPAGLDSLLTETDHFRVRIVRSATGHKVRRYLITTTIEVQGKAYLIEIGLSDRTDMKKQVLIGRRFLREQGMLVDVCRNVEHDDEGERLG